MVIIVMTNTLSHFVQKESTLHLILRLRGMDNVANRWQQACGNMDANADDNFEQLTVKQGLVISSNIVYTAPAPVTIAAHSHAMVALQTVTLTALPVLVFDAKVSAVNALRAVQVVNTSGVDLVSGTANIIEGGQFKGQVQCCRVDISISMCHAKILCISIYVCLYGFN